MAIDFLYSYLVHPGADGTAPPLRSTEVDVADGGKLIELLEGLFSRAPIECDIDIEFISDGNQTNPVRADLLGVARAPSLATGEKLASRLRDATTHRSKLGLFFIAGAGSKKSRRILLSRFPADAGILAEEAGVGKLKVTFLERVFMKNSHAYKSAFYQGDASAARDFWQGAIVDRQINTDVSEYWIKDFLESQTRTTSEMGTKRLASAIRKVLETTSDPDVREEVSSLSRLVRGLDGKTVSVEDVLAKYSVGSASRDAVIYALPNTDLADEKFVFSATLFNDRVGYRLVSLNNGALLGATNQMFEQVFNVREGRGGETTFATTGSIVADKLRKREP